MAITRQKKESILKDLFGQIKKAQMIIFVNFHGLNTVATRKAKEFDAAKRRQIPSRKKNIN